MRIAIEDLRFRQLVIHLNSLGPRALAEFLVEVAGRSPDAAETICERLRTYRNVTPALLKAMDCDRFPPAIYLVGAAGSLE